MPSDPSLSRDARPAVVEAPESRICSASTAKVLPPGAGEPAPGASAHAGRAHDASSASAPVAMIVSHGMGEQVPFETLNMVAEALWAQQSREAMDASAARVRYVAFGDDWLPRVELTLRTGAGTQREVHLYEVYWAPVTEGKVTARDAVVFLFGAGMRGMRYCARGSFDRWMFGRRQEFALPRRGLLQLGVALVVLLALCLGFIGFALASAAELFRLLQPGAVPAAPSWLPDFPSAQLFGALSIAAIFFAVVRWFLVESVGDVAAYVSAHRASRFTAIRRRIQEIARGVARNVYGSRVAATGELEYPEVIVVGHSLGSVIAYDMLNDAINGDLLAAAGGGTSLDVVRRTRLLLTMGSPLDKTAFLFRTQKDDAPLREALAAAAQPMIVSYENRPARWLNIWSPFDWVCGSLEYYDVEASGGASQAGAVENVRDSGAPVDTVRAHLGYWKRSEFGERLYAAIGAGGGVTAEVAQLPGARPAHSQVER
jgi:hypothetical protein